MTYLFGEILVRPKMREMTCTNNHSLKMDKLKKLSA